MGPGNGGLNILNKPVALRTGAGEPQTERHSVHSSIGPQHRLLAGDAPSIGAHGTSFLAGAPPAAPRRGKRQARLQASRTAALPNLGPRRQHKSLEPSQISARAGFICLRLLAWIFPSQHNPGAHWSNEPAINYRRVSGSGAG